MFKFIPQRKKRLDLSYLSINEKRRINTLVNACEVSLIRIDQRNYVKSIANKFFYDKIVTEYVNNPNIKYKILGVRVGSINFPLRKVDLLDNYEITKAIRIEFDRLLKENYMNIFIEIDYSSYTEYNGKITIVEENIQPVEKVDTVERKDPFDDLFD